MRSSNSYIKREINQADHRGVAVGTDIKKSVNAKNNNKTFFDKSSH